MMVCQVFNGDYEKLVLPIKNILLKYEFKYFKISNELLKRSKIAGDIVFSITQFNNQMGDDIITANKYINKVCDSIEEIKLKLENNTI